MDKSAFSLSGIEADTKILFYLIDEIHIALQIMLCNSAMGILAEKAIVKRRNISGDQLPFTPGKRVIAPEQYFSQFIQRFCRFRAKCHGSPDTRKTFG